MLKNLVCVQKEFQFLSAINTARIRAARELITALFISCFFVSSIANAADHHTHSSADHQQEAHIHGIAELFVIREGNVLELGLRSPASNIVGFEHVAVSQDQHRSIDRAKAILQSVEKLFFFTGGQCTSTYVDVDFSSVLSDAGGDEHDKHGDQDKHSEVSSIYRFSCRQGVSLKSISVELFDFFPGIQALNASWITDSGQSGVRLTAKAKKISLR